MTLGHFAVAFGAKSVAPRTSLGTLILAAQFVDLLWPTLLLLGVEHVVIVPGITAFTPLDFVDYPVSHSLLMVVLWGLGFAAVYYALRRYPRGALVVGVAVLSHWLLDVLVHRPDLPLSPLDDVKVGLGLWSSVAGTMILELGLFAVGVWLYARATVATDRIGRGAFPVLVVFLLLTYVSGVFGPPPPDVATLAWAAQAQWLLVAWGYWLDRHRGPRPGVVPGVEGGAYTPRQG